MHISTKVVGARHRNDHELKLAIAIEDGSEVELVRDPHNPYDSNAIKVEVEGHHIGFIPKATAADLAPLLDTGHQFSAVVSGHHTYYEPALEIDEVEVAPPAAA